jgi:hypothetical protein
MSHQSHPSVSQSRALQDLGEMTNPEDCDDRQAAPEPEERPMFLHPDWMVGVVLIFAAAAVFAGLDNPIWLLVGSPFILVFALYTWVRFRR